MGDMYAEIRSNLNGLGNQAAIEFAGKWYNWNYVEAITARLEQVLDECGLPPGSRIALIGRNRPWHVAALLGLLCSGRTTLLINPFQAPEMIADNVAALGVSGIVTDDDIIALEPVREAADTAGILCIAIAEDVAALGARLPAEPGDRPAVALLDDVAVEMLTSGTTGKPKRIAFSFDALDKSVSGFARFARGMGEALPSGAPEASVVLYSPLVHIAGLLPVLQGAREGRRLICMDKFTVTDWVRVIKEHRINMTSLPPTNMRMLLEHNVPPEDLASLKGVRSGGAALDAETREQFEKRYGIPSLVSYGATEFGGPVTAWSLDELKLNGAAKLGSVGRVDTTVSDSRIVDPETGESLPVGSIGVLELRPYRMGPEWMRTTDLASFDADGYLFLHGRADDAINRGGFKIVPEEVAKVLRLHPNVADAAVLGMPDPRLGAVPMAVVERRLGATPPIEADLLSFARSRLVKYQIPVRILIVDALPRVAMNKISKPGVRALLEQAGDAGGKSAR